MIRRTILRSVIDQVAQNNLQKPLIRLHNQFGIAIDDPTIRHTSAVNHFSNDSKEFESTGLQHKLILIELFDLQQALNDVVHVCHCPVNTLAKLRGHFFCTSHHPYNRERCFHFMSKHFEKIRLLYAPLPFILRLPFSQIETVL